MLVLRRRLKLQAPNIACTQSPEEHRGYSDGTLRSARFQAVCVASSWFRQNGVISSRPPAPLGKNTLGDAARRVTHTARRSSST